MARSNYHTRLLIGALLMSMLLAPLLIACAGSPAASSLGAAPPGQMGSAAEDTDPATTASTVESAVGKIDIPLTAAGRHVDAWLKAFNSGDQSQLQRFLEENVVPSDDFPPGPMAARLAEIYKQSGPLTLKSIEEASETEVSFVVQQQFTESLMLYLYPGARGAAPYY